MLSKIEAVSSILREVGGFRVDSIPATPVGKVSELLEEVRKFLIQTYPSYREVYALLTTSLGLQSGIRGYEVTLTGPRDTAQWLVEAPPRFTTEQKASLWLMDVSCHVTDAEISYGSW